LISRMIVAFAVVGALDSFYLSLVEIFGYGIMPKCCRAAYATIHQSVYAKLAGVPVAFLGVIGYILLLVLAIQPETALIRQCIFAIALVGTLFSARLIYVSVAKIGHVCPFCALSAIVMTEILVLATRKLL